MGLQQSYINLVSNINKYSYADLELQFKYEYSRQMLSWSSVIGPGLEANETIAYSTKNIDTIIITNTTIIIISILLCFLLITFIINIYFEIKWIFNKKDKYDKEIIKDSQTELWCLIK